MRLALKLFRGEPAISGFDWNFSPIHTSSPPFSTDVRSAPPFPFTETSTWTWIGHPVSGLPVLTLRPIQTCSRFGSMTESLNLASTGNSPDRSTKSTRSHLNVLPQFVNTGFQVLFHSPPGVLFTFPSQYYALSVTKEYLALEGGPSDFPQGFSCLVVLWIPLAAYHFPVRGFHSLRPDFPDSSGNDSAHLLRSLTPACTHAGLGSSHFARRYFGNRCFFLFLWLLRCFSSPGSPPYVMDWRMDTGGFLQQVSPFRYLRINGYLLLPEAFRSLSRLSSALSAKASTLRSY